MHALYHGGTDEDHLDVPPKHPGLRINGGGYSSLTGIHLLTRGPGIESTGPMTCPPTSYTNATDVHPITGGPLDGGSNSGHTPLSYAEEVLFMLEIVTKGSQQQRM